MGNKRQQQAPGTVLVTGAARRIGAAICRRLHTAGYAIALHYQSSQASAEQLAAELNHLRENSCQLYQADLAEAEALADLCQQLQSRPLAGLVNNAAVYYPLDTDQETLQHWDQVMNTNLRAAWYLCRQLQPQLALTGGCIVNITDACSSSHSPGFTLYELSKLGLTDLTRKLALEFAPAVRVNAVAPGAILWPEQGPETDAGVQAQLIDGIPLQQLGQPEDIAEAVHFLMCQASYTTGQVLAIDGGRGLVN